MTDMAQEYDGPEDDKELTLVDHLLELRSRIVKMAASILIVFVCLSPFMKRIFEYLSEPLMNALPQGAKLLSVGVIAPFMVPLKVTLFASFLIALPYVLWQVWCFIAPGLYRKERRLAAPIVCSSLLMFVLGMVYCYFVVFKMVFQFIAGFAPDTVSFAPDIDSYFNFVITLFVGFGLAFEVPIVVVVLNRLGVTSVATLKKASPYTIVGAFVLAAIFTPPDVLSQMLLAIPLVLLYQVGLWLCKFFPPKTGDSKG